MANFLNKVCFWTKRHSPELLIAGGIAAGAGAIITAIIATTKVESTLKPLNEKIKLIKNDLKDDNKIQNKEIDVKESKRELAKTYAVAGLKMVSLYAPSALLFATSVCCTLGSHSIMKSRNLALTAACATLERSYNAYRSRVKEKLGEEVEEKLYKNMYKDEVEVVDPETGEIKKKKIEIPHDNRDNAWNVIFDNGNCNWTNDAILNFDWLMLQQDYLTTKLQRQGYLFLSDVYDVLGFTTEMLGEERARASHILGWIYDPKNPKRNCYISFGLTQPNTRVALPKVAAQIESNNPSFWLSLNPDGDILSGEHGNEVFTKYAKMWG